MTRAASGVEIDRFFSEAVDRGSDRRDAELQTDFAITSINVPDRLDMQSLRGLQDDGYRRPRWFSVSRSAATIWLRRALGLGLLAALAGLVWLAFEAVRAETGKEALSARISAATGLPVAMAERELTWLPAPGIMIRDLRIGPNFRADRVQIQYSWDGLTQAISRRGLLPEATISPMVLSAEQAIELASLARALHTRSELGVGAVRFESVSLRGMPLLPGQYEILMQRQPDGGVAPTEMSQLGGPGEMQLRVWLVDPGTLRFELSAQRWTAPVGPAIAWDSLVAQGRAWARGVVIENFTAKAGSAQVDGAWAAASDVQWSVAATVQSNNADLDAGIDALVGLGDAGAPRSPLRGRASFSALGSGHGPSLTAAVARSVFAGQAQARALTLTGINLGVLAAKESPVQAAGGTTRLSEVTAALQWSADGVSIRDIRSQSGGMLMRGQIAVSPALQVSGALTVDLAAVLPESRLTVVKVGGTLSNPSFSRP
jgi:hypothetical protein